MPNKGETLPYKVKFTYAADVATCGKVVKGTQACYDEDEAMRNATDLARLGASVTVDKVTGPITTHVAQLEPWTDQQHRLAELAEEVIDLRDYDAEDQTKRMFEIRAELAELAINLGVTRS